MTSVVRREQDDSGEYSDGSHEGNEQNNSGIEGAHPESDYDSRGSESDLSDGANRDDQEAERRVDDDEDRSNPQYIPKRGTFYEHDDRTAASGELVKNTSAEGLATEKKEGPGTGDTPTERRRAPRKSDICDKWKHDKYNEHDQTPKSRDELVSIYGYDIRNEEAPPHARRNRRYGRGPNKYTRTWEDEDAYKRQGNPPVTNNRKPPNLEDFPELDKSIRRGRKTRPPRSQSQPTSNDSSMENGTDLRRNASIKVVKSGEKRNVSVKQSLPEQSIQPKQNSVIKQNPVVKKNITIEKLPIENLTITSMKAVGGQTQRKVNPVGQQLPVLTAQQTSVPNSNIATTTSSVQMRIVQAQLQSPNSSPAMNRTQQQPVLTTSKASKLAQVQQMQQQQIQTVLENRSMSKRYSNLRQRPLAEPYSPQPVQPAPAPQPAPQPQQLPQPRYVPEYQAPPPQQPAQHQGSPVPQLHPQQQQQQLIHQELIHQVHRTPQVTQPQHGPSPPHQTLPQQPLPQQPLPQQHTQQVRMGILEQQLTHAHTHQLHNIPQAHTIAVSGQLPPGQAYPPPAMMPAQFMQGGNNAAVFAGAAMFAQPPPAPYPHQLYQHHNYATSGGVTYYSPAEQEQALAPRAQRRPTAAIPIVKPSPPDRPLNSSEKDNIDRIVENMFVRRPWPSTQDPSKSDSKQLETRTSQEPTSKESSQPNSLTSSSVSTDSRPSTERFEPIPCMELKAEEVRIETEPEEPEMVPEISPEELITTTKEDNVSKEA